MEMEVPNTATSTADLQKIMDQAANDAREAVQEEDSTLTLGAIGSAYMVGPIDITLAIGNMVLLNEIDSPFITGEIGEEGSELDTTECIKSLYVLAMGEEAVKPVMAIKQRVQSMLRLKPMVEKNPDLFSQLMDRVEAISNAHTEFELAAIRWYEANFVGWDFQEVVNEMFGALDDALTKAACDMPETDSKKND